MQLIDADALMKNIGKIPQLRGITYSRMKRAVEETPTIDAEPVRYGRWTVDDMGYTHCSWCGKRISYFHRPETKYCPNCGAKMDGGAKDV